MSSIGSGYYAYVWVATGILAVFVPIIYRSIRVNDFKQLNMMYNWDQEWDEQQQQQGGYNNNNNNAQSYYQQIRESYEQNDCKWWQLNCFPFFTNYEGEPEPGAGWYPSWYSNFVQTEEEREMMEEEGRTSPAMRFVYVWQILTFLVILAYGFIVFKQRRVVTGLLIALVIFANMSFLAMWWLADGSIITDGDYVQEKGFYGQFPVLMFITNAAYVLFGLVHTAVLYLNGEKIQEKYDEDDLLVEYPTNRQSPDKKIVPTEFGWTVVE